MEMRTFGETRPPRCTGVVRQMPSKVIQYSKAVARSGMHLIRHLCQTKRDHQGSSLRITYVPGFDSQEDFVDQYYRMLWYMHPIIDDVENVFVACSSCNLEDKALPPYMDPRIVDFGQDFEHKLRFFPDDIAAWEKHLSQADILMQWNVDFKHRNAAIGFLMRSALKARKKWRVDRHNVRFEGSFYLKLSHDANTEYEKDLDDSKRKFEKLTDAVSNSRRGYLFGTGPSLAAAMDCDFSDGTTIICNSIVTNVPLMRHLNPRIITIADPIFHAGCSSYAGEFRKHLCNAMDGYDVYVVVPFRDYKVYTKNLPQKYQDRIIGIPLQHIENANLDLTERFVVKSTANVLTLLMLPIAATLFDELGILGCDGRKLEDDRYFWDHHQESQLNEQMQAVREAHPAFFDIDYNDYYLTHCEVLEKWLSEGEKKGIQFKSLTHSFIPALRKRSTRP